MPAVSLSPRKSLRKPPGGPVRSLSARQGGVACLGLGVLLCSPPVLARPQQLPAPATAETSAQPAGSQQKGSPSEPQAPGTVTGFVVAPNGGPLSGARVKLVREGQSSGPEVLTGDDGQFSFNGVPPGPFQVAVSGAGFDSQTVSGTLRSGETAVVPRITLAIAANVTEVSVTLSREEVAEVEVKEQEKQRVFGAIPNFYVSYVPNAAPLTPRQKFQLAWRTTVDPVSFVLVGIVAGFQQGLDNFHGYGQGAQGYGKRYGAAFADSLTSTFLGNAVFPSILKQDPRYFYKGSGSKHSRILYAIANAIICKGDNGHWQANYSGILGSLASGGISNLYYPSSDRGARLVFENTAIGLGAYAAANLFQEFVVRKLTPKLPPHASSSRPSKSSTP